MERDYWSYYPVWNNPFCHRLRNGLAQSLDEETPRVVVGLVGILEDIAICLQVPNETSASRFTSAIVAVD